MSKNIEKFALPETAAGFALIRRRIRAVHEKFLLASLFGRLN